MNRRQLLIAAAALPSLTFCARLFAAPASAPRTLLVFLRGGYDCNNLLVPYSSDFYYESRPTLAIARPEGHNPQSAIALDSHWGLNPVLRDSLYPLWQRQELAFVPFAGTDDLSRSHFQTQDTIEAGQPSQQHRRYDSGFLARLARQVPDSAPIAFTDALPLSFQGGQEIPNLSLRSAGKTPFDERQAAILASMYQHTPYAAAASDGLALRQKVSRDLQQEMLAANRGAANAQSFAAQTRRMAGLMREQYRLGFVDVGGWDTHVNQGSTQGQLASNLANLGQGLAAYAEAMGEHWKDSLVVVVSEFGRTFRENGARGTDHGHGTVYWVLGGSIRGGRLAGEQVTVNAQSLLQNRDYPVLNNYRDLLGGLLGATWGLSSAQVQAVFPGSRPATLGLV
ncbi:DUF1501 domain-containing protein [Pseudomonas protegens]|uniref:DUF1501 domain-containing protein n=1 Tax=Pseudomonas protegens TaxID=380021 RepID=UPI00366E3025